ncbi:MAG: hypothetical protein VW771_12000, partial [Gammaproteobacteria bacterium]
MADCRPSRGRALRCNLLGGNQDLTVSGHVPFAEHGLDESAVVVERFPGLKLISITHLTLLRGLVDCHVELASGLEGILSLKDKSALVCLLGDDVQDIIGHHNVRL